jgi:hypothetical protein
MIESLVLSTVERMLDCVDELGVVTEDPLGSLSELEPLKP